MKIISKNTVPQGFKFGGIHCGIKKKRKDLGLIYSETPALATGLFTVNKMQAAPIKLCKRNIKNKIQAVIANSGNANCAVRNGFKDALLLTDLIAQELKIKRGDILSASTGIIGVPLPMDKIKKGIPFLIKQLKEDSDDFAQAILTTDKVCKQIAVELNITGRKVVINGIAKGSGMISPNMATMLCFLATDIDIDKRLLMSCLKEAVQNSFNQITVDGEMSTNDTVLCLANGEAGNKRLQATSYKLQVKKTENKDLEKFQEALNYIALYLAKEIVKDGEGATKIIEVEVKGAKKKIDAEKIACHIANSNLIKTMFYGESTNYGRIAAAVGSSGVDLNLTDIYLVSDKNRVKIFEKGYFLSADEKVLKKILGKKEIKIVVDLKKGDFSKRILTCDLSEEYVRINAEY
ncbi:MAG: bifunctional glutamate N-acetyltransferase/amino-acid acetyltransferase ArgJ [Candidatus Omnitrophica bacterium]|nr:bifunctional glutamate N-acetyltransferase/amino-acid acetyltransferase ArgJ [Candidatus Omnitrophota bacterium]